MKKSIILFLILILFSCESTTIKNNSSEDIEKAKKLTNNFYEDLEKNDTILIYNYLDHSISKVEFNKLIVTNNKEFGHIKEIKIVSIDTKSIITKNSIKSDYKISIDVMYEKTNVLEYLLFEKTNSTDFKLSKYLIQNPL